MKKILLSSLMAAAAAVPAFAGVDNINYQAVIKNGNQIVANSQVDMKFELLDNETVVYSEQQSMTTNASGLVSCQLGGEGLNTIEWGDLTLRVSINFGSGYEVLSNETVSSVPTALYALRSADTDNIREEVDAFASMVETRIDKIQTQADSTDSDLENIKENLTNAFNEKDAEIAEINGQLENLNMVAAVVRENEATIDEISQFNQRVSEELAKLQGLDADEINDFNQRISDEVARINEALALLDGDEFVAYVSQLNALKAELEEKLEAIKPFSDIAEDVTELKGQVENLNMVAAVVRENEAAVEELNTNVDAMATMVETRIDKLQNQVDNEVAEINGQLENLNNVAAVTRTNEEAIENLTEQVDAFATMNETRIDKLQNQVDNEVAEINGQLENLNNVAAVTRANEEAIENLTEQVDAFATMLETRLDKIQNQVDGLEEEVTTLKDTLNQLIEALKELDILPSPFNAGK